MDEFERYELIERLQSENAATRADIAARRERQWIEEDISVSWSGCRDVGSMTSAQFSAWCDAGRPALTQPQPRGPSVQELRAMAEQHERDMERRALLDAMGEALGTIRKQMREHANAETTKLRAELAVLRGELASMKTQ